MIKQVSMWSVAVGAVTVGAAAQTTIEQLAPENSIVVVSVTDFQQALTRFKNTGLWALWKSDQVQAMLEEPLEEGRDALDEALQDLGLEEDDFAPPQGPVGLAFFPGPARNNGMPAEPGFMLLADYGASAPHMDRIVNALMRNAEEDGVEFRQRRLLGRTVYTVDLSELELPDDLMDLDDDDFDPMMGGLPAVPDPDEMLQHFQNVHFVRDGRNFMVCSDLDVLGEALMLSDENEISGLSRREDFQAAVGQLGPVDGYAVVLLRGLGAMLPPDPMVMMMQGMVQSMLGDIHALSFGVRLDSEDAMIEKTFAVYMPNGKSGLTALMDVETPQGELPPFVFPGTIAYSRMNFRFSEVMGFLRGVAMANPMLGAQINQMLLEYGPTIEQVCSSMGPEVHSVVTMARPMAIDSLKSLYAIESSRPQQVEAVLAEYAGAMGLHARDLLGQRIYSMDFNPMMMGMPMAMPQADGFSIGFGAGYVMAGNTSLVEDALRAGARSGMPNLADDPAFQRAARAVTAPRSVAWGVVNVVEYLEYFKNLDTMIQEQVLQQMQQFDPAYAQELAAEFAAQPQAPWKDFDLAIIDRYLGPLAWELRARENGFVGRYLVLEPEGGLGR